MPGIHAMHIEVVIAQVALKAPIFVDPRLIDSSLFTTHPENFRPATPVEIACSQCSGSLYQAMEALLQCDHLDEVLSNLNGFSASVFTTPCLARDIH